MNQPAPEDLFTQPDHPLILVSRVKGTPVFNSLGERIGHVDDLSVEKISGRVVYAIISFGGFLGIGEKFHPLPWSLLDYDLERSGFVVPLDQFVLENAPNYDPEELRALGGPDHRQTIFGYYGPYGATPYW